MKETVMLNRRGLGTATALSLFTPHVLRAQRGLEITVHVPQPVIFRASFDAIGAEFARREPEIRVNWITTPNYEEGMQLLLRQAATNNLTVDVSYQGFNRLRLLAERGIAQDLAPWLAREGDPAAQGYTPQLLALAHFGGIQAGLPYAASNPITFLNADLVRRAGADPAALPRDWDGIIALASRIREQGVDGMVYNIGNEDWMFSALLFGHGGRMLSEDEREVLVGGPEGLAALRLIERFMREARMPLLSGDAATQAFAAGRLGLIYRSTAFLRGMMQQVGRNFEMQTAPMPVMDAQRGRLPTGGAAGTLIARDQARREAAWKFLRFSTSAEGTTLMVQNTGYVPMNQIAIDDPRWLGEFYRDNPLFRAATEQVHLMVPWTPFPGANSVRITQAVVDNVMRVVEGRATPEVALADMAAEMRRQLPRSRG
jgi:multiple sugar transport system substrate-binding protein